MGFRLVRVHHEHHDKFAGMLCEIVLLAMAEGSDSRNARFYSAGSTASTPFFFTKTTRNFGQGDRLAAPDPFDDRPFQHVDEGVGVVPMDVLHSSGRILDAEHQHLPSGYVSEILLHDGGHNRPRRSLREGAAGQQGCGK